MDQLWPLDPRAYERHALHVGERTWVESNCYVDLWVELLHTAGMEPLAAFSSVFAVDVEGDQWTFFKFPSADLYLLYGVEVFELNVWRPLLVHLEEQLRLERVCLVEVDAFHLPDTAGTSYRTEHVKTTIGIQALDGAARRLGYFHNAGYYELAGADFAGVFRLDRADVDLEQLPPYVEVAKLGAGSPRKGRALITASLELLRAHLARRPLQNPFRRYGVRFASDLEWLAGQPLTQFHAYAFATLRQCGAAFELGAAYLRWLEATGEDGLERAAVACDTIATSAKALQFKTARAVATGRPFDPGPAIEVMAAAWDETMHELTERYGALVQQG
jgi:hypothetical protein